MGLRIGTFNCRDFFDDAVPNVIGHLDREGFGVWAQRRARSLYARKLEAVANQLRRMNCDVVAFQEIEGPRVLDDLRTQVPELGYLPAVAGNADERGIACGMLSRLPVTASECHTGELGFPTFATGDPRPFAGRLRTRRGVLEAQVALPDGATLVVLTVHLKSPRPIARLDAEGESTHEVSHQSAAEGAARTLVLRLAEALELRSRVEAWLARDSRLQLCVLGDFNDGPESVVLRSVAGVLVEPPRGRNSDLDALSSLELGVLHQCSRAVPTSQRFSIVHRGVGQLVDHILVSRALWRRFEGAKILNEELRDSPYEGREEVQSDHAPLVAWFR